MHAAARRTRAPPHRRHRPHGGINIQQVCDTANPTAKMCCIRAYITHALSRALRMRIQRIQRIHSYSYTVYTLYIRMTPSLRPLASQRALERLPDQRKWSEPCSRMSRVGWQLLRWRARRVTSSRTIAIGGVVCGGLIQSVGLTQVHSFNIY